MKGAGEIEETGEVGELGEVDEGTAPFLIASCKAASTPFAGAGGATEPSGEAGCERMALPSSEEASYNSGGSRSFSISDLRLQQICQKYSTSVFKLI